MSYPVYVENKSDTNSQVILTKPLSNEKIYITLSCETSLERIFI